MRSLLLWMLVIFPTFTAGLWAWNGYHLITSIDQRVQQATQAAALAAVSQAQPVATYDSQGDGQITWSLNPNAASQWATTVFQQALAKANIPGLQTTPVSITVVNDSTVVVHETATYTVPGLEAPIAYLFQGKISDQITLPVTATATIS